MLLRFRLNVKNSNTNKSTTPQKKKDVMNLQHYSHRIIYFIFSFIFFCNSSYNYKHIFSFDTSYFY